MSPTSRTTISEGSLLKPTAALGALAIASVLATRVPFLAEPVFADLPLSAARASGENSGLAFEGNEETRALGAFVSKIAWTSPHASIDYIRDQVNDLLRLPDNWDAYGALAVKPEFAASAVGLIGSIVDENTPAPAIVPMASGGVQVEWHVRGIDLEIAVESTSRIGVWYEDNRTGQSWEVELSDNVERLAVALSELSRRL